MSEVLVIGHGLRGAEAGSSSMKDEGEAIDQARGCLASPGPRRRRFLAGALLGLALLCATATPARANGIICRGCLAYVQIASTFIPYGATAAEVFAFTHQGCSAPTTSWSDQSCDTGICLYFPESWHGVCHVIQEQYLTWPAYGARGDTAELLAFSSDLGGASGVCSMVGACTPDDLSEHCPTCEVQPGPIPEELLVVGGRATPRRLHLRMEATVPGGINLADTLIEVDVVLRDPATSTDRIATPGVILVPDGGSTADAGHFRTRRGDAGPRGRLAMRSVGAGRYDINLVIDGATIDLACPENLTTVLRIGDFSRLPVRLIATAPWRCAPGRSPAIKTP